jgi:membrane-bound lytic murein transglycosylase MltF
MGNLTTTPDRQKLVDFGPPIHEGVDELVVTEPAANNVTSLDDLVATGLYLRPSSSYYEHMQALNAERVAQGKQPIPITEADENLEDYDLLDMVNAGVLKAIVVDSHKAAFWEQVFDCIEVHRDISVHSGNQIAWAMRKNSPALMSSVAAFSETVKTGSLPGNILRNRYFGETEWLDSALAGSDRKRYDKTITVIKRYADRYEFDWLIITAQAYQESRFDQDKRSSAGAVGVMQILPGTAADSAVDICDISKLEKNIHAGVKYLHWLLENYYSDPKIAPLDQVLFSFVAYNAGPGNMARAPTLQTTRLQPQPLVRQCRNRHVPRGDRRIGILCAQHLHKYYVTYQGLERHGRHAN